MGRRGTGRKRRGLSLRLKMRTGVGKRLQDKYHKEWVLDKIKVRIPSDVLNLHE